MKTTNGKKLNLIIGYLLLLATFWSYSPVQYFLANTALFNHHNYNNSNHRSNHHKSFSSEKFSYKVYLTDYDDSESEEFENDEKKLFKLKTYYRQQKLNFFKTYNSKITTALNNSQFKFFSNPFRYICNRALRL